MLLIIGQIKPLPAFLDGVFNEFLLLLDISGGQPLKVFDVQPQGVCRQRLLDALTMVDELRKRRNKFLRLFVQNRCNRFLALALARNLPLWGDVFVRRQGGI